jgi:hypothetical protein
MDELVLATHIFEKKNSKKHKRQKRLFIFHEKLVKTHGLPSSKLMVGKNLTSEFDQIAGVEAEPDSSTGHDTPSILLMYSLS